MSSSKSLSLSDNNSIPSGLIDAKARNITDAKLNVKSKEQYKSRNRTMIVWMHDYLLQIQNTFNDKNYLIYRF